MNIIITCGPSYEPVDRVRRLTNFSTGALGVALADAFAGRGWRVFCLKGELATCPGPLRAHHLESFSTNDDLAGKLHSLARAEKINAVLHAAALCDFKVERAANERGETLSAQKIPTRAGRLQLTLTPTLKVLPLLRGWFPAARLVGWKYEVDGPRDAALAAARAQLRECRTDACVLNGPAWGEGFGTCLPDGAVHPCMGRSELKEWLGEWLATSQPAG